MFFSDELFSEGEYKGAGRASVTTKVSVSGINWECLTVRTISLQFDIGLPTTRKVLTYYLRIERTCSHCVPYCFQTMTDKIKVLTVVDLIDNHLF